MSKPWHAYALHILEALDKLSRIQRRGDLMRDEILYDATLRNLQTLSESTQRLPEALKLQYPGIPWKQIGGFRNILVHNYLGDIDPETVQAILTKNLPPLEMAIRAMLATNEDGE